MAKALRREDGRGRVDRIVACLKELAALDPSLAEGRKRWGPAKLDAFEEKVGCSLPPELRGFLTKIGEGGRGFWSGMMAPFEKQNRADLARANRPFPLVNGWVPSSEIAALKEAGLYRRYQKYLTPLPRGASATDGTLTIGVNEAGERLRVVLAGRFKDAVWIDNRGSDFQEMMPTGSSLLELFEEWLAKAVTAAKERADVADAITKSEPGRRPRVSRAAATRHFEELRKKHAEEGTAALDRDVALAMFEAYRRNDPESAGQALLLGELWEELRDFSEECLDQGRTAMPYRGPSTHAVHLGLARARLGDMKHPEYPQPLHYYHRYSGTIAATLARWPGVELARALEILPAAFALETLSELSTETLRRQAKTLRSRLTSLEKRLASESGDDGDAPLNELKARLKTL